MAKVYIAGPMRGGPNWNFDAFHEAEIKLAGLGWRVFNPAKVATALGYGPHQESTSYPDSQQGKSHLKHVMMGDIACLYESDAIALLPGWEKSKGATVELALAQFLGLQVIDAFTGEKIQTDILPWHCLNLWEHSYKTK